MSALAHQVPHRSVQDKTAPVANAFGHCFLCAPSSSLIYARTARFFAMLGVGPISEGYSVLGAMDHVPSMFDLTDDDANELVSFTTRVRRTLQPLYGDAVVAEHGRIAPCVSTVRQHEQHCLHAHRLVFPGRTTLDLAGLAPFLHVRRFESFDAAREAFSDHGQYVYVENADGHCEIANVPGFLPRQFLRALIAREAGMEELADWRRFPRPDVILAAQHRLLR
jgi:diadenosine tetraphosphate (Ap4A) HIT family hydrolase